MGKRSKDRPKPLRREDISPRVAARFWDRVDYAFEDEDRCWIWRGALKQRSKKYSHLPPRPVVFLGPRGRQEMFYAYRVAYALYHGVTPQKLLRHRCNNELCMNVIKHVVPSTKSRNVKDMWASGVRGARRHSQPDGGCCDERTTEES